ncbi:MAG: hypothetical protein IPK71_33120 [Myxococcales bacterium]|jgi:hypothetical protein|nr:hypothetical protein [Myxococcales bacterium]
MRLRLAFGLTVAFATTAALASFAGCSSPEIQKPPPLVVADDDAAGRDSAPPPVELDSALPQTDATVTSGAVYLHTGKTLFLFEPYGKTLKKIGDFSCLGTGTFSEVGDIAVNRDGEIYGTTLDDTFIKIDPLTASCTVIAPERPGVRFPNSLSFVPRGTLDPANDALVGYFDDEYVRIDVTTGKVTSVGFLNPRDASTTYESSGDIVSVGQDRTYLSAKTYRGGSEVDGGDVIVRFDPKTGQRIAVTGSTNRTNIWGMGYWAGVAYGFTSKGEAVAIDPASGASTPIPLDAGGATSRQGVFYGAGSTTVAPTR